MSGALSTSMTVLRVPGLTVIGPTLTWPESLSAVAVPSTTDGDPPSTTSNCPTVESGVVPDQVAVNVRDPGAVDAPSHRLVC